MTKSRDSMIIDYNDLKKQLSGISPKLSIYKEMEAKIKDLESKIGGNESMKIPEEKREVKPLKRTYEMSGNLCSVKGCPNPRAAKGRNKDTGFRMYRAICEWHKRHKEL